MLKRSKLLVAFLLVTVICASVGFASVSDTLTADGKVNVNVDNNTELEEQFNADVYFSEVTLPAGVAYVGETPTFTNANVDAISFTLTDTNGNALKKQGDTVTITAKIKNASTVQAVKLSAAIDNANLGTTNVANCISITHSVDASVTAGGEATLTITVTMNKVPDVSISDATFKVTVTAEPTT